MKIIFIFILTLFLNYPCFADPGGCEGPPANKKFTDKFENITAEMDVNYFTCEGLTAKSFTIKYNGKPLYQEEKVNCQYCKSSNFFEDIIFGIRSLTGGHYECKYPDESTEYIKWGAFGGSYNISKHCLQKVLLYELENKK